jgi:aminoglycoside phosphotransferase family enzyme/predicted kinase
MDSGDQSAVLAFLADAATYGGVDVERIDTHISVVFLAGDLAYKLKRAVRFDYVDFSTLERRRQCCEQELVLNGRTAPQLYRRIVAVTREAAGGLALGGSGQPVEWLVEMRRFQQDDLFERLAARHLLPLSTMAPLADAIVSLHGSAAPRPDHGGLAGMGWVVKGNNAGLHEFGGSIIGESLLKQLADDSDQELTRQADCLEARRQSGFVRQCHGDLHLRNVVLLEGVPTLFDGVEFNDEIACTDVQYDLAFLLMDLWRRRLPAHANVVWNRYLAHTTDWAGIRLQPLFLSCRAAVRAKTSATASRVEQDGSRRRELETMAREYVTLAGQLLHPPAPALVAIGGLSGSGKSTMAADLAPALGAVPGAVVLRSDEFRKRLCGVPALQHLGPEAYLPDVSKRVYGALTDAAALIIRGGHSAIVDAVHGSPSDREHLRRLAAELNAPFFGFWLEAPTEMLAARITRRHDDVSDADVDVLRRQTALELGQTDWVRIDASQPTEQVLARTVDLLGRTYSPPPS